MSLMPIPRNRRRMMKRLPEAVYRERLYKIISEQKFSGILKDGINSRKVSEIPKFDYHW